MLETPVVDVAELALTDRNGDDVTEVVRGDMYNLYGTAVTAPEGGVNSAVRFVLTGEESPRTFITSTGMLHVSESESSEELTVQVISVDDNSFSETIVIPVVGTVIDIWPVPVLSADNDTLVTPKKPTKTGNVIHVPTTDGLVYKNGANVIKDDYTLTANATITASALPGYEIPAGKTASWDYVFNA
jgi:hypothetical protein